MLMTASNILDQTTGQEGADVVTVTPRDLHFANDAAESNAWLAGDRVGTAVFNALSLTFPDGERLFMDAVRHYRGQLSGRLLDEAKAFIAQEAIHSREHIGLNAQIDRAHYPVDAIEAEIRRRTNVVRDRGPMAMLGVTIALEHFTGMMADLFLADGSILAGAPPEMRRLWQWHAMKRQSTRPWPLTSTCRRPRTGRRATGSRRAIR